MRSLVFVVVGAVSLSLAASHEARAYCYGAVSQVLSFDAALGELPEGVAVDVTGDVFVGLATTGEILKLDNGQVTTYAELDNGAGYALGMTTDGPGTLYVVLTTFTPGTQGLYRVSPGGDVAMIAEFDAATTLPDDVALSYDGYLYVTEAIGGAIYRVDKETEEMELWFQDELLVGDPENTPLPFPVGANGVAVDGASLVVSNTQRGRIVRVPIDCDGYPEDPLVIAEDPLLHGADGIALSRADAYLGVMVDDLTSRGVSEPYRMFTSRAEFRLSLRADNADRRLTPLAQELGLVSADRIRRFEGKQAAIEALKARLEECMLTPPQAARAGLSVNQDGRSRNGFELLSYADIDLTQLAAIWPELNGYAPDVVEAVEIDATYAVYLERQRSEIALMHREESLDIPADLDFSGVPGLSNELKQKLAERRPSNLAAAQRIDGMTPAALAIIIALVRGSRIAGGEAVDKAGAA